MDFQSPGGLGTGQKARGAESQEQEEEEVKPQRNNMMGKGLGTSPRGK
jgi:hypothetical protein